MIAAHLLPDPMPLTIPVAVAAEWVGCSTSAAYEAIRSGDFPVPVLRVGRKIVVPTRPLLEALGIEAA
jgi:predicted site-specific integrase-resolvase